jgi:hypothetical protein
MGVFAERTAKEYAIGRKTQVAIGLFFFAFVVVCLFFVFSFFFVLVFSRLG